MSNRIKIIKFFGIVYIIFSLAMYIALKLNYKYKYSENNIRETISGKSLIRDTTDDLCKYQILGDPKEANNYVKIEINCNDGKKANSTVSLLAIEDKTVSGFLKEYSRIIGFDEKLFIQKNVVCYIDGNILTEELKNSIIRPTATINCKEN